MKAPEDGEVDEMCSELANLDCNEAAELLRRLYAALRAAEAKIEQAALIVEGQSVAVNHLPPSIGGNSLAAFLTERDFRAANQIRALRRTHPLPTQGASP